MYNGVVSSFLEDKQLLIVHIWIKITKSNVTLATTDSKEKATSNTMPIAVIDWIKDLCLAFSRYVYYEFYV